MVVTESFQVPNWLMWCILYVLRRAGLSKYGMWLGIMLPSCISAGFPTWCSDKTHLATLGLVTPGIWVLWALLAWLFNGSNVLEKRARRYLESRPKPLELVHRERISDSLVWLRFRLPDGFTTGLSPGQHVRVHCPNPSRGMATWNDRPNLEDTPENLSRSYTPVSAPDAPALDLVVRDYEPDPNLGFPQGGRGSAFLGRALAVGAQAHISGPHGHKVYHGDGMFLIGNAVKRARHCAALVGGSGITPILALLRDLRAEARVAHAQPEPFVSGVSVVHVNRSA